MLQTLNSQNIIHHHSLRQTKVCKSLLTNFNDNSRSTAVVYTASIHRVGINHYQHHLPFQRTSIVQMQACPWPCGPVPRVQGASGGSSLLFWQVTHCLMLLSTSQSIPGYHTYIRAKLFVLTIPLMTSCSCARTASWYSLGIMTREPHRRYPP